MPEGYRHDIQHGNQCEPQRLPDIAIASPHVFECDVNEKTPVQCMNTLRWSCEGNRPILNIPEPPKLLLSVWNQISIMTVMISHDSILPVPEEIPH